MLQKRQKAWVALGVLVMILLLTTTYSMANTSVLVDLIRQDQKAGQARAKETKANTEVIKRIAEQIESCTSPDGECYKRGQERTGKAVASINDVILATAACDEGDTPLPVIRECVESLLRQPRLTE